VIEAGPGARVVLGAWPPNPDGVLTLGTELVCARLLGPVAAVDPESWRDALTPGWALWSELLGAGVRAAGIEHPVSRARIDSDLAAADPVVVEAPSPAATRPAASRRHDRRTRGRAPGHGSKPRR
jgi:hypothetical protein